MLLLIDVSQCRNRSRIASLWNTDFELEMGNDIMFEECTHILIEAVQDCRIDVRVQFVCGNYDNKSRT